MTIHPAVIHRYQVIDRIGRGGMGTVYLARDPVLDRLVAIKLLRADLDSEQLRERFIREARAAARLSHLNIVAVFDVGEHEGQPFIAMEYIQGETVFSLLERRADLPLVRRLHFMKDLCAGLSHAHRFGIIHRDIKPINLIVTEDQTLKILDFGIAHVRDSSITEIGALMGTVSYMSPEQSFGLAVDHRADVFSVGAVFYELLSYRKAFPGRIEDGVLHRIQHEEPAPLESLVPGLHRDIIRIVSRALEKDRTRRYDDLSVMRRDIIRVLQELEEGGDGFTRVLDSTLPAAAARPPGAPPVPTPSPAAASRPSDRRVFALRRAAEIESRLQAARAAFEAGDYEAAIGACEEALFLDPDNAEADEAWERARSAALAREVGRMVREARELVDRGSLTSAGSVLDRIASLDPSDPDAASLRRDIERLRLDRELARQRQAAIEEGLGEAALALEQVRFADAAAAAERVLSLDPACEAAAHIRRRAGDAIERARRKEEHDRGARAAVESAVRQFEAGDHAGALEALAAFRPPHEVVSQAVLDLAGRAKRAEEERRRVQQERAEHTRRLTALVEDARGAIRESRFDEALAAVEEMRRIDPAAPLAEALAAEAREGRATLERRETHSRAAAAAVEAARARFDAGDRSAALAALGAFRPTHDLVTQALLDLAEEGRRIDEAQRVAEQQQVDVERRLAAWVTAARTAIADGRVERAFDAIRRIREIDPAAGEAAALEARAEEARAAARRKEEHDRAAQEAVAAARERFETGDRAGALAALADFRPPHDLVSVALLQLGQEAQGIDERQRRAVREKVEAERRLLALVVAARTAVAGGRLEEALAIVRQMREIDPEAPEAQALTSQVEAERARRSAEDDATLRGMAPPQPALPPPALVVVAPAAPPLLAQLAPPAQPEAAPSNAPRCVAPPAVAGPRLADITLIAEPEARVHSEPAPLESFESPAANTLSQRRVLGAVAGVAAVLAVAAATWWLAARPTAPTAVPAPASPAPAASSAPAGTEVPAPPSRKAAIESATAPAASVQTRTGPPAGALLVAGIARDQLARGDRESALATVSRGIEKYPGDRGLSEILDGLEAAARQEVATARRLGLEAGADASPRFQEANELLRGAAGRPRVETIRAYWHARALFDQLTAGARAAAARPALTEPSRPRATGQPVHTPPVPAQVPAPPAALERGRGMSQDDEEAIRQVLSRWKAAMEGTSTAELKSLQDNLTPAQISGIENLFLSFPTRTLKLQVLALSAPTPDVATVRCSVVRTMRPANPAQAERNVSELVTFRLERRGAWRIVEMRGFATSADR